MAKDIEAAPQGGEFSTKDYSDPPPAPIVDFEELTKWSLYRAVIAEFVATLLFLYITVATVIGYKHQSDPTVNTTDAACSGVGILGIAWAFGGMIFVLVYCTAGVSGPSFDHWFSSRVCICVWLTVLSSRCIHRWAHQPGGDVRAVPGEEGVAHPGAALHHRAVPRRHLRRRAGQGLPELLLRAVRRRRQRAQRRLLQGHRARSRDHRHLRARLHRLLRHRPQAQRP
uniref:Uncharacterized protein n=1 Tax=Aegilops tauschii subsp. strangulata TaxID=200361 RepID=A0A453P4P6_AEGTS